MKNFILPLAREKTGYLSMATSEDSAISTGARKKKIYTRPFKFCSMAVARIYGQIPRLDPFYIFEPVRMLQYII